MWPALLLCSGPFGFASSGPQPDTPHDVLLFLLQNLDVEDAMLKWKCICFMCFVNMISGNLHEFCVVRWQSHSYISRTTQGNCSGGWNMWVLDGEAHSKDFFVNFEYFESHCHSRYHCRGMTLAWCSLVVWIPGELIWISVGYHHDLLPRLRIDAAMWGAGAPLHRGEATNCSSWKFNFPSHVLSSRKGA